ncbi:hypothetical protein AKJ52_00985 [candidate division MSBL1 archaeon SCGC-AAA382C18]|uniref:AAA+ ATPase domain-containing protein n=1 Tax=candidate division MSBL1 archaeon SCGC-AAA382C18 TaxID=1698281 RepID=A0A133VKX1_9EURY|nr:hypothetical protein AKJ52_00985 [candidate division MSBL1 archaeon SCGC-AAA382C18]
MIQSRIENGKVYLGQKGEEKPNGDWSLSIGRAVNRKNEEVLLDSSNPHVIFVCGTRGSGKSYTLGVLSEELAENNPDVGAVIVDPIGVFWSMKYPNQEKSELELLKEMDLKPHGIDNVRVFIPSGYKSDIPDETFDTEFSFRPNSLHTEDWCLTFGIDRYSPQGLLLEKAVEKIQTGYTRELGDKLEGGSRDVPPNKNFTIDDLIDCINHDRELTSKEKGFRGSTRRALTSRLGAAKDWGIFGKRKRLSDLIRPGETSVIDISFLPENIGSLVLGILARKILAARKSAAREEAVKDLEGGEDSRSGSIPPTWLMVDEAHSFAPSSGKTAATDPLVEYVKQGRRPGLTAVLSTQQPSALNSKIISQLDILISHRLTFEDDIKEVRKRMPTSLPEDLKDQNSLKRLSEGTAIVADRQINRAFVASIRPRFSQHEGRERVTGSSNQGGESEEWDEELEGAKTQEDTGEESDVNTEFPKKEVEILSVPFHFERDEALEILKSERNRLLNILWITEEVKSVSKCYYPMWGSLIDYYPKGGEAINVKIQMDGLTGELLRRNEGRIMRTNGVRKLSELVSMERKAFFEILRNGPMTYENLRDSIRNGSKIKSSVDNLIEEGLIDSEEMESSQKLMLGENIEVPSDFSEKSLLAAEEIPDLEPILVPEDDKVDRIISEENMLETLESFGEIEIINRELFYYPYWIGELVNDGESRIVALDGVSGLRDEYAERMLRRRL